MSFLKTFDNLRIETAIKFINSGGTTTLVAANPSAAHTITLPDPGGNDSIAYLAAAQTLSNKTLGSNLLMAGFVATGSGTPVNSTDLTTKGYVDSALVGLEIHAACQVAATTALPANTYSGGVLTATANAVLTVDGYTVLLGDRVLVAGEATGSNNGIYTVTQLGTGSVPYKLTRATDYNTTALIDVRAFMFIQNGTANGGQGYASTHAKTAILDTTALTFSQFSGGQVYTQGNGISIASNVISAVGDGVGIAVTGSGIGIKSGWNGTGASISLLGTVTSGVWNGSAIQVAYGGTGAGTAAANTAFGNFTGSTAAPGFGTVSIAAGGSGQITAPLALAAFGGEPLQTPMVSKAVNYARAANEQIVQYTTSTSNLVDTLPTPSTANKGIWYTTQKVDATQTTPGTGTVALTPASGNINGVASLTIDNQWDSITCYNDGTNYFTI